MRWLSMFLAMALGPGLRAQQEEHPFIESFLLLEQQGRILVQWTMKGGSTCDGSAVERSTNGVQFAEVHRIEGLCGDPDAAVTFTWADADPPELSTLHYRIQLGTEGRSSTKSLPFQQLTRTEHRFFPSPTEGEATLLLKLPPSARVNLDVFDASGRPVLRRAGLQGAHHDLDLRHLASGPYTYVADSEGRRFTGRFVKE